MRKTNVNLSSSSYTGSGFGFGGLQTLRLVIELLCYYPRTRARVELFGPASLDMGKRYFVISDQDLLIARHSQCYPTST